MLCRQPSLLGTLTGPTEPQRVRTRVVAECARRRSGSTLGAKADRQAECHDHKGSHEHGRVDGPPVVNAANKPERGQRYNPAQCGRAAKVCIKLASLAVHQGAVGGGHGASPSAIRIPFARGNTPSLTLHAHPVEHDASTGQRVQQTRTCQVQEEAQQRHAAKHAAYNFAHGGLLARYLFATTTPRPNGPAYQESMSVCMVGKAQTQI
ncbi:uncharacterized protein MONBRDRAFT_9825 [Monosiga brevicollis MX1]|uniref:Uncharacterized protein n=1 Tax=Monosiga brevicollis TaxID=81824 RepID=A9V4C3_MONBE|nr:uncharacterized protein MONBRDRAFT_9825 [Monosiga brevicollis MX1]EDQ87589.1 predicted protein [Monosiga brevicollis MX1]|eukprot:XP_001747509.1 hypothetical protein [Monosiga brevicollis MX1]